MEPYPNHQHSPVVDAIALFGQNSNASHLVRLFTSVGIHVYRIIDDETSPSISSSSSNLVSLLNEKEDLPFVSSVLINCQDNYLSIQTLLNSYPKEYKQRMAYIECSSFMREIHLRMLYHEMGFHHYLCMNLIELDSSTTYDRHIHLICSGDEIVFQKLILQSHLPTKSTYLQKSQTPFDSFHLCLLHRYSQAIHFALYAELMAIFKEANSIYPAHLQFLFDWFYIKRPLMRQMILQSSSSSFTLTTIHDLQLLLECSIDSFFTTNLSDNETNHLKVLTHKFHQFISNLDQKEKEKAIYELFHLY